MQSQKGEVVPLPTPRFELLDHTDPSRGTGYLRLTKDGRRVADVFPYAAGGMADWTIQTAREIVADLNALHTPKSE